MKLGDTHGPTHYAISKLLVVCMFSLGESMTHVHIYVYSKACLGMDAPRIKSYYERINLCMSLPIS